MLSDLKAISKDSLIYGIGNVVTKIVGFILIPIYTNPKFLSVTDFGVLSILDISSQVLVTLFGLTLYQGFMRWYWDIDKLERKKLFFTILSFIAIFSITIGVVLYLNSSWISQSLYNTVAYTEAIQLVIINAILTTIQVLPNSSMRIQGKSKLYTTLSVIKFSMNLLLTIYFVVSLKHGITGIFEAQIIGNLLYFIIAAKYIIKNSYPAFKFFTLKKIFIYSYPLVFASMSGVLLSTIDRFSLNELTSLNDVAVYSLGYKIGGSIKVFIVTSIQLALTPIMLKRINDPNNGQFYSNILTYFSFGLMWVILFISVYSHEIVNLIAKDPEYYEATYIIPIIAMIAFFGMVKENVVIGLQIKKQTKIIGVLIIFASIINIVLNIILIPIWGIYGAAWGSLITQFLLFISTYFMAQRSYPIQYKLKKIILIILIGGILFWISLYISKFSMWTNILLKFTLILSYPVWFFIFSFLKKNRKNNIYNDINSLFNKLKRL